MKRVFVAVVLAISIVGSVSVASVSAGSSDVTTTTETVLVEVAPVPIKSGTGRRIVYANRQQRVWVINKDNEVIRTFPVSGMLGQPGKGTFEVFSKSPTSYSPEFAGVTFRFITRFAIGRNGGNIGFHEIPIRNSKPMQTVDELGAFKGSGCLRSSTQDALFIYQWATIGTKVVVVP
ncbi:MAG: murein L,D-transpeptidase [Actinobacteria bacterium]|nr:MAG: murein L,D-transpeptidase [Actinomycetota bacterium]